MGYRSNITPENRGFYYANTGNDILDGQSLETPKLSVQTAIDECLNLIPPASTSAIASVREAQGGIYQIPALTLRDGVGVEGTQSSFVLTGAAGVTAANLLGFNVQALISSVDNTTLITCNNVDTFGTDISSLDIRGEDSVGISVEGVCDSLFFTASQVRIVDEGGTALSVSGQSVVPIDTNFNNVSLEADNTTFVDFSPADSGTVVSINASSIFFPGNIIPTGSTALKVDNGIMVFRGGSLAAEMAFDISSTGIAAMSCDVVNGDISVADNGALIMDTVGVVNGDITVTGSATFQTRSSIITGDLTVSGTGGVSVKCDSFTGNITVGAGTTAYLEIDNHVGTLSGDGEIRGHVNGQELGAYKTTTDSVVIINRREDFPNLVGSVSTLDPHTRYKFRNGLTEDVRLIGADGAMLEGDGVYATGYIYTGTDPFLTMTNIGMTIDNLAISCPNATQALDITGTLVNSLFADKFRMYDCLKLGTFTGAAFVANNFVANRFTDGFSFTGGPFVGFSIVNAFMMDIDAGAVHWDFDDGVFLQLALQNVEMDGVGTALSSSIGGDGNLIAGTDALVTGCTFGVSGTMTGLSGFTDDYQTVGWEFVINSPSSIVEDSRASADMYLLDTNTVTVTQGVYNEMGVPANGSWTSDISKRFVPTTDGGLQYIGNKSLEVDVLGVSTVEKVGGGSDLVCQRLSVNFTGGDSGIEKSVGCTQNSQPTQVVSNAEFTIQPMDTIKLIWTNDDSNSNVIVQNPRFVVKRA